MSNEFHAYYDQFLYQYLPNHSLLHITTREGTQFSKWENGSEVFNIFYILLSFFQLMVQNKT